jgi:hypothetical protein
MQEQPRLNIDFKNTSAVTGFDGGHLFGQAVIIRKISKFLIGADEDATYSNSCILRSGESKKILNRLTST